VDSDTRTSGPTYQSAPSPVTSAPPRSGAEPGVDYVVEPFSGVDLAIHISGGLLFALVTLPAIGFLVVHSDVLAAGWPLALLAFAIGTFVADFISGLLHWMFDTWFSEKTTPVRRMVTLVREHHVYPERIFNYSLWHDAGMLSWFALLISAPLFALAILPASTVTSVRYALAVVGVTTSLEIVFMLEFHKCGHRVDRGRVVRTLQRLYLLLSPEHHLGHHSGGHESNYCLINGLADRTLGRLGAFRALEYVVSSLTGATPRESDREWLKRFGRLTG
jgi:hypothetical protein